MASLEWNDYVRANAAYRLQVRGTSQAISELNGRKGGAVELALYQKTTMGAGQHAANPMLQETPDPLTKVTWDNYVTMAHSDVDAMGLNGFIGQEKPASRGQGYCRRRFDGACLYSLCQARPLEPLALPWAMAEEATEKTLERQLSRPEKTAHSKRIRRKTNSCWEKRIPYGRSIR